MTTDRNQSTSANPSLLARLTGDVRFGHDIALALIRGAFGLSLALAHGLAKVSSPERFLSGLVARGFPLPGVLGWAAIASELVGGILLALGLLTRPAATFVLATLSVAAFNAHAHDPFQKKELALAYAVVALALLIAGPGRYSLDALLFAKNRRQSPAKLDALPVADPV